MEILNRPPERLYRYRSATTDYLLDEIEQAISGKIYFSEYSVMNDPFEATPRLLESSLREFKDIVASARAKGGRYALPSGTVLDLSGSGRRKEKAAFKKKYRDPVGLAARLRSISRFSYNDVKQSSNLVCLSERSDSLLMWAHYGAGHNGIVFEYEFDESAVLRREVLVPVRVRYASERPSIGEADFVRFSSRLSEVRDPAVAEKVFDAMWLTKSADWSYEKEWRLISWKKSGYVRVNSLRPVGVIIGVGVDEVKRKDLEQKISGRLSVKYASLNRESFSLDFVDRR